MTHITDRRHLAKRIQTGIGALLELQDAWLEEDHTACAPRSAGDGPSSPGISDPTLTIADTADRYRHRDELGRAIHRTINDLQKILSSRKPRETGGPCRCCERDTATHGHNNEGHPTTCYRCYDFLRRHNEPCNEETHRHRSYIRMCECPPTCCDVCPDRTEDGRALSRRCRARKTRGLWHPQHAP